MKKIDKDLAVIPPSLVIGDDKLTHQRRLELIAKKHYINEAPYNCLLYTSPSPRD